MRIIEIDLDIHKSIELERRNFEETPSAVLRRLLRLPDAIEASEKPKGPSEGWLGGKVALPSGTRLRMRYNGRSHHGEIAGAIWRIEGSDYHSPSGAAGAVARTKGGRPTKLNGWNYWEVQLPESGEWQPLMDLWRKANGSAAGVTLRDLGLEA